MKLGSSYQPPPQEGAKRRFWTAFFVAFIVWLLAGLLVCSVSDLSYARRYGHRAPPGSIAKDWPEFGNGEVKKCVDMKDRLSTQSSQLPVNVSNLNTDRPPTSSSWSFDLPVDSDALYFFSRGSLAEGTVDVDVDIEGGDNVRVEVVAYYWSEFALGRTSVCELERAKRQRGIGIFVSSASFNPVTLVISRIFSNARRLAFGAMHQLPIIFTLK